MQGCAQVAPDLFFLIQFSKQMQGNALSRVHAILQLLKCIRCTRIPPPPTIPVLHRMQ